MLHLNADVLLHTGSRPGTVQFGHNGSEPLPNMLDVEFPTPGGGGNKTKLMLYRNLKLDTVTSEGRVSNMSISY